MRKAFIGRFWACWLETADASAGRRTPPLTSAAEMVLAEEGVEMVDTEFCTPATVVVSVN